MNGKDRAAVWRERVEAWKRSGQNRTEFAAGHGIDRWTLGRWIRRLAADEVSSPGHGVSPMDKPMAASTQLVMEILSEEPRRRRWSAEEKLRLVAETLEPGMTVSLVARRRGISTSQLFRWRQQFAGAHATPVFPGGRGRAPEDQAGRTGGAESAAPADEAGHVRPALRTPRPRPDATRPGGPGGGHRPGRGEDRPGGSGAGGGARSASARS